MGCVVLCVTVWHHGCMYILDGCIQKVPRQQSGGCVDLHDMFVLWYLMSGMVRDVPRRLVTINEYIITSYKCAIYSLRTKTWGYI
jgi:hypothetical protein